MTTEHFTIEVPGATITFEQRRNYSSRDYSKSPRMYVSIEDESILDNLANRKRRPYNVYKTLIHSSGISKALDISKLSWSQYAGCSCPCSPGFILNPMNITNPETGKYFGYFDVWVTLHGAPSVDETKPARVLAGL